MGRVLPAVQQQRLLVCMAAVALRPWARASSLEHTVHFCLLKCQSGRPPAVQAVAAQHLAAPPNPSTRALVAAHQ